MNSVTPTFWRFGGLTGWQKRTESSSLAVSDAHGLRLAAAPDGPLSFQSKDGSLGGLVLPRGMAFDDSLALYLLGTGGVWLKRWNAVEKKLEILPEIGGIGSDVRRFHDARAIALAGGWLYVADTGNRRVQVFNLATGMLEEILSAPDWSPCDLTAHHRQVWILDSARARVYCHSPSKRFRLIFNRPDRARQWTRIIADKNGKLYLLNASDPTKPVLETMEDKGPGIEDPNSVRDLFEKPAIGLDEKGRFTLPQTLAAVCGRSKPKAPDCEPKPTLPRLVTAAQGAWLLYMLRRAEKRVDVYAPSGRLRHSWGRGIDWQPADVAACGEFAFILDEQNQQVYRHRGGSEDLKIIVSAPVPTRSWSRIACDRNGSWYLWDGSSTMVQAFGCAGQALCEKDFNKVAALFERPTLPDPALTNDFHFDRNGDHTEIEPHDPSGPDLYQSSGAWRSAPLNSGIFNCQWHRVEMDLSAFPPGSRLSVRACAHANKSDVNDPTKARFIEAGSMVAPLDQSRCPKRHSIDFLVRSGPGQYLTVEIQLDGDRFSTPSIEAARVHFPRDSYLQYLPATYAEDDEGRLFLERFLSIFQSEWDALEMNITESEKFFDPDAVPEGPLLEHLARQWLALPLEADWTSAQKRRLLAAAPKIYAHRGKLSGLRDFISVYLANLADVEVEEVRSMGFPAIVEGFREREHFFLSSSNAPSGFAGRLGEGAPLWSANVTGRLQLGVHATEGEVKMVSTGAPEQDVFNQFAHRFRVYMPSAWVRTAAEEKMIRRALDAEKPGHTKYDLCLIEPRFRFGTQSTMGVDTILGIEPTAELACLHCVEEAPSLPPARRLSYDTLLSCARGEAFGSLWASEKQEILE